MNKKFLSLALFAALGLGASFDSAAGCGSCGCKLKASQAVSSKKSADCNNCDSSCTDRSKSGCNNCGSSCAKKSVKKAKKAKVCKCSKKKSTCNGKLGKCKKCNGSCKNKAAKK